MPKIDLMIFDMDGTLIDSKRDIAKCVNLMLKDMGHQQKQQEEIYSYIGLGIDKLMELSLDTTDHVKIQQGLNIFRPYIHKHLLDTTVLFPGVEDVLKYFKDKKKVIISNRDRQYTMVLLKHFGIDKYFEFVMGGDEVTCRKPSPCPINKVLSELGVDRKSAIITGDMTYDIISGKEAGIYTCAVSYGIGKADDLKKHGPDFFINSIAQLKNIII